LQENKYDALLERDLEERQKFAYPPFYRLIKLVLKHRDYKTVDQAANKLKQLLQGEINAIILGPESPHVSRIRNLYIKEILIKINKANPDLDGLKRNIRSKMNLLGDDKVFRSVIVYADVDPG
jgi:primosomal protein N' (replication factor Y)